MPTCVSPHFLHYSTSMPYFTVGCSVIFSVQFQTKGVLNMQVTFFFNIKLILPSMGHFDSWQWQTGVQESADQNYPLACFCTLTGSQSHPRIIDGCVTMFIKIMTRLVTWEGLSHIWEQASIFGPMCLVYKRIMWNEKPRMSLSSETYFSPLTLFLNCSIDF